LADIFEKQGVLTADESNIFKKTIGFRNLLAHVYPKIDSKIVF
jgi:uncharacterized protein YutE (UPF0331/DUF86 family)